MQSIYFDDYKLSSESAFDYVTHKMIEMIEKESETIKDLSCYRWAIGYKVANYIFPKHPTKIFDYDVKLNKNRLDKYKNRILSKNVE